MKRILCYGDSNTWGMNSTPLLDGEPPQRFDENTRWTSLLQKKLGSDYRVFEGGHNGRTTVFTDPTLDCCNGFESLPIVFYSCDPLDLVIIMLGTNDSRDQYVHSSFLVAKGMERLLVLQKELIAKSFNPKCKILVVAPPKADPTVSAPLAYKKEWADIISELPPLYEELCQRMGVFYVNAYDWADLSPADGLHLSAKGHAIFAENLEGVVRSILE